MVSRTISLDGEIIMSAHCDFQALCNERIINGPLVCKRDCTIKRVFDKRLKDHWDETRGDKEKT